MIIINKKQLDQSVGKDTMSNEKICASQRIKMVLVSDPYSICLMPCFVMYGFMLEPNHQCGALTRQTSIAKMLRSSIMDLVMGRCNMNYDVFFLRPMVMVR